jgi:hypothetical protein
MFEITKLFTLSLVLRINNDAYLIERCVLFSSKLEQIHFCFCHKISDGVNEEDQEVEGKMQCD